MRRPITLRCIPILATTLRFLLSPLHSSISFRASAFSFRPILRTPCNLCGPLESNTAPERSAATVTRIMSSSSISSPCQNERSNNFSLVSLPREWLDYDLKKDEVHRLSDLKGFCDVLESPEVISDNEIGGKTSSSGNEFDTIVDTGGLDPKDMIVALDLGFRRANPPQEAADSPPPNDEKIQIRLNRDAQEIAHRTFQRLELSLAKKLSSGSKTKKKNKKSKNRKDVSEAGPSSKLLVCSKEKVRTTVEDSSNSSNHYEIINTENVDAIGLCRELASLSESSSIRLDVSMPLEEETIGENSISNDNSKEKSGTRRFNVFRFEVDSNLPVILATQTFESFRSKLFVGIPVVVQTTLLHATNAKVSWFLSSNDGGGEKEELVLRNSHAFVPEAHHIGKSLSVVIIPMRGVAGRNNRRYGKPEAYKFRNVIEVPPNMPIVSPLRDAFAAKDKSAEQHDKEDSETPMLLRVCTYNILADLYVSRKGTTDGATTYPHVKYEHVEKSRRIPMIVAELKAYHADIICLQEVDGSVYDAYLQPVLKALGYDGYYSNKASSQREGCAIFWSTSVFEEEEALSFDVKDLFVPSHDGIFEREWRSMKGVRELLESHAELKKVTTEKLGQVLQIARLKPKHQRKGQPKAVVVANTHLFWHPMADHVRAMQAYAVAKKIDEVRHQRQQRGENNQRPPDPFLLCGDLNSDPLSGAYQLLATRSLSPDHRDCWKYFHDYKWDVDDNDVDDMVESGTTAEERRTANRKDDVDNPPTGGVATPPSINLPDSFPYLLSGCDPNPPFTNFSLKFAETLDYVLASQPSETQKFGFVPHRSAPMPSIKDVEELVSMPNEFMPSDHVSIVCDLRWCTWDSNSPE